LFPGHGQPSQLMFLLRRLWSLPQQEHGAEKRRRKNPIHWADCKWANCDRTTLDRRFFRATSQGNCSQFFPGSHSSITHAAFFQAILASIIIVALRKILIQIFDLPGFWRKSRLDGIVWVVVFLVVIIVDADVGLGVGFVLSAGSIFFQGLKAYTCLLGHIPNTDLYLDTERYKAVGRKRYPQKLSRIF